MKSSQENYLKRIADALDRISPPPLILNNLDKSNIYQWSPNPDILLPMNNNSVLALDLLIGINSNRDKIFSNTLQFAKGFPANNILLWGARGTGKSSLIKFVHSKVSKIFSSLKLIQIQKEDIGSFNKRL